jgi:16S rRNA (guanine527-N7)-methyltransferase
MPHDSREGLGVERILRGPRDLPSPAAAVVPPGGQGSLPALESGVQALGLNLPDAMLRDLLRYEALILKWNRVYNLTALRSPGEVLTHHLLDSLAAVPPLQRWLGLTSRAAPGLASGAGAVPAPARPPLRVLDVGSGAGLPGVVLALVMPDLRVTCVDAVGKKAAFIQQVAGELGLKNLRAEHVRVESLREAPFDLITSRAFSSLPDLVRLTAALLAPGGVWMAMKGKRPDDELRTLPDHIEVFHVEPLQVPGLDAERCLVWMRNK